jgi:hypothetical protein
MINHIFSSVRSALCSPRSSPLSFSALSYTVICKMSFEIIVSQVCSFVVYIYMIRSKQRMINEKDELDDELKMATIVLIGQYRKRMRMNHIGRHGSFFGHEVHDRSSMI